MDLVPKLPDLSQTSVKLFDAAIHDVNKTTVNKYQLFPKLSDKKSQKINYSIEENAEKPFVNLKQLNWLLDVDKNIQDKNEVHQIFMNNYQKIFQKEESDQIKSIKEKAHAWSRLYKQKELISQDKNTKLSESESDLSDEEDSKKRKRYASDKHNIGLYLEKIHNKTNEIEDPTLKKLESFKRLRKLVRRYPFERTEEENKEIFDILLTIDDFVNLFSKKQIEDKYLIRKFTDTAYLEAISTKSTPAFGHFAFYMILKGSVKPLSTPHLNLFHTKLRAVTPEPKEDITLGVGSCFGTITPLHGRDITTRMFRVVAVEDKCEFLKLSINSFEKIFKKITDEERNEKLQAIKNCKSYSSWPKHTIEELMEIFEWKTFSANTILASEGYRCPFIAFINKGECHALRKVDVPYINKKTGQKEKRMKQVVIGKLKENDSFGEVSVTLKEPMTCSIVTETKCRIGVIPFDKISRLDNITLRLLLHTSTRNFGELSQHNIYEKFIEQEKKKEWKDFKSLVVKDVIDKYGIINGTGKFNTAKIDINFDNKH